MAYYNTWEDLKKEPQYAGLSDQELMSLFESFKTDPSTALLMARNSAKARQSANIDKAIQKFYQSQDDFDRTFNPESYNMRRSGLGKISMPIGGRAGMINLHRPQYIEDMNQSIKAPVDTVREHKANQSANSLEAERNHSIGWLKGSEQHRAKLEQSINDYDKEIAKLQAEIAMSESGDPMYNLAIMRLLMDDDNSLLMDIRGRIGKKIDQEFQAKMKKADQEFTASENEKNRENTREIAEMNRAETKAAQQQDLEDALERAKDVYMSYQRRLSITPDGDPRRAELEDQANTAELLMKQAYRRAKRLDEFDEIVGNRYQDEETIGKKKSLLYSAFGITGDDDQFADFYANGDAAQRKSIEDTAKLIGLPLSKLPKVSGIKANANQKAEQTAKAVKVKNDFKSKHKNKTFEMNIADGKPKDLQAWNDFASEAKKAGWTVEYQRNGSILWK